ncbi:MAG: HPF/RaiA family ribosome-associated protein [Alphaproteobacteria bacterium]|nr:HPF/RaiA family ribosome-associated protein [Alphaproteobacteria bacterium]
MPLEVSFRNIKPREEIRNRAEVLYGKLERFLDPDEEGHLIVNVEHSQAVMELVVVTHGDTHKVVEEDPELRTALDRLFHTMETQLRRRKERRQDRRQRGDERPDGFVAEDEPAS